MNKLGKVFQCATLSEADDVASRMSTEQMQEAFQMGLRIEKRHLLGMAALLKRLEEAGIQINNVDRRLLAMYREIAQGRLEPDVVVKFTGHTLDSLRALPVEEQRELLKEDPALVDEKFRKHLREQKAARQAAKTSTPSQGGSRPPVQSPQMTREQKLIEALRLAESEPDPLAFAQELISRLFKGKKASA
jgi:hypothetical protein